MHKSRSYRTRLERFWNRQRNWSIQSNQSAQALIPRLPLRLQPHFASRAVIALLGRLGVPGTLPNAPTLLSQGSTCSKVSMFRTPPASHSGQLLSLSRDISFEVSNCSCKWVSETIFSCIKVKGRCSTCGCLNPLDPQSAKAKAKSVG